MIKQTKFTANLRFYRSTAACQPPKKQAKKLFGLWSQEVVVFKLIQDYATSSSWDSAMENAVNAVSGAVYLGRRQTTGQTLPESGGRLAIS